MQAEKTLGAEALTGNPERAKPQRPKKISVDLSGYPDLVVVYLGFRVSGWQSLLALFGIGPKLNSIQKHKPAGLLAHETVIFGLNHIGLRQYWQDLESLETFTRSDPHKTWWAQFSKDPKGAGFWHEAYRRSGGIEGIYLYLPKPIGLASFAPARQAAGSFERTRQRLVG
jgi:hypothetical protein